MRYLVISHAYDEFLTWLYASEQKLESESFAVQLSAYYGSLFGSSDFYSHALKKLGHDVHEAVCNNMLLQTSWWRENSPDRVGSGKPRQFRLGYFLDCLRMRKGLRPPRDPFLLLLDQVRILRPDVIFNQSVYAFDNHQLRVLKQHAGCLVGEHAAMPLPATIDYRLYDLIVSSFPPTIVWLREHGARAELNRLAFDPRVADIVPVRDRDINVSFSGSFLRIHQSRLDLVEAIAVDRSDLVVHGNAPDGLTADSPLIGRLRSPLWGRAMFDLLRRSVITLNHHGDVPPFANNMRLYESTGMGCLLITDYKSDLNEIFEPDKEVVSYRDAEECLDKIKYYLDDRHSSEREAISAAGRRRTLSEHTYDARIRRLVQLIDGL